MSFHHLIKQNVIRFDVTVLQQNTVLGAVHPGIDC
jgi:hypothetical protein